MGEPARIRSPTSTSSRAIVPATRKLREDSKPARAAPEKVRVRWPPVTWAVTYRTGRTTGSAGGGGSLQAWASSAAARTAIGDRGYGIPREDRRFTRPDLSISRILADS